MSASPPPPMPEEAPSLPAWTVGAGVTVLIVGLCALESLAEPRSGEPAPADRGPGH